MSGTAFTGRPPRKARHSPCTLAQPSRYGFGEHSVPYRTLHGSLLHINKFRKRVGCWRVSSSIFPPRLNGDGSLRKSDSVTLRKEPAMANKSRPSTKSLRNLFLKSTANPILNELLLGLPAKESELLIFPSLNSCV